MKNEVEKFLEFNGKSIYFLAKDGTWWIAIKPICEALGVDYSRQLRTLKSNKILGRVWSLQTMHDKLDRLQKMVALPEEFVYGWIFKINSPSPDLEVYQWECYQILYRHFHGTITSRQNLLKLKAQAKLKKEKLIRKYQNSPEFQALIEADQEFNSATQGLKKLDQEIVSDQMPIWRQGVE